MRFMYLIQGKAANVARYLHLNSDHACLRGLTYDQPLEAFDFLPKSSYARGRNHLYQLALESADRRDYYIFLDDDVEFARGSFQQMEQNLALHRPAIGIPITEKMRRDTRGILRRNKIRPLVSRQRFFLNDEQYLAISRAVLEDGKIFPCPVEYEEQSWFVASAIQQALIQFHYHDVSWQFNDCEIANDQHAAYPRNLELAMQLYRQHMKEHHPGADGFTAQFGLLLDLDAPPGRLPANCLRFLYDNFRSLGAVRKTLRRLRGRRTAAQNPSAPR